jgi:hypothetical protein
MRPAGAILVDQLSATRQHLKSIFFRKFEGRRDCIVSELYRGSIWVLGKESQYRLDELIVGWDCHLRRLMHTAGYGD